MRPHPFDVLARMTIVNCGCGRTQWIFTEDRHGHSGHKCGRCGALFDDKLKESEANQ